MKKISKFRNWSRKLCLVRRELGIKQCVPIKVIASEIYRRHPGVYSVGDGGRDAILGFYNSLSVEQLKVSKAGIKASKSNRVEWGRAYKERQDQRLEFYVSDAWRALRYTALRKSRGVCELCGDGPSPGKPLHVDHIKPRSHYPELELELDNLQILCKDCNLGKSNRDEIDWRVKMTA